MYLADVSMCTRSHANGCGTSRRRQNAVIKTRGDRHEDTAAQHALHRNADRHSSSTVCRRHHMHACFFSARTAIASLSQCAWHMDTVDWRCWKTRVARGGMITVAVAGAPWRMAACRRHLVRCKWEKHSPCCDRLQRCATARRTAGALPDDLIVVHPHNAASGRNSKAPARSPGGYARAGVVSRVVTRASPMQPRDAYQVRRGRTSRTRENASISLGR